MTDEYFLLTLDTLIAHASQRCDQTFQVGDRKQFQLWDSRLSRLNGVTAFERWDRERAELSQQIDKLMEGSR